MADELTVISTTYDLILWTHNHVQRFPRASRFSLGVRIEQKLLDLLEHLLAAKFSKEKAVDLRSAALIVEHLRFLFRICKDTRLMALKRHQFVVEKLVSLGRQINAWRKSVADRQ